MSELMMEHEARRFTSSCKWNVCVFQLLDEARGTVLWLSASYWMYNSSEPCALLTDSERTALWQEKSASD